MSERTTDTLRCDGEQRQAMSIHTRKITDSCRDKDCIEDLRIYLTTSSQATLDTAANAKVRCAELITTAIDVEPVAFDRSHYCIDLTFYYRVLADATVGRTRPTVLNGLAVFSKRAVLCGEDIHAHIYRSNTPPDSLETLLQHNRPTAVVEVLDPMVLSSKITQPGQCGCEDTVAVQVPEAIRELFDEPLVVSGGQRQLYVTLGQFSIIRLEQEAQLLVPVLDYAIPCKDCCGDNDGSAEDPCEMFSRIPFPTREFSPRSCDEDTSQSNNYTTC